MNGRLVGLSVVAVLLGGYEVAQYVGPFGGSETAPPVAVTAVQHQPGAVKLNPLEGLSPELFPSVVEHPLFNPGRMPRPPAPLPEPAPIVEQPVEEPPPAPTGPGPEDYKLLGVSSGPEGRVAAVRIAGTGEVVYLRKGEAIDSWSILDVGDRTVVIGTAETPVSFGMFDTTPGGAAPAVDPGSVPVDPAQATPLPAPQPQAQPAAGQ